MERREREPSIVRAGGNSSAGRFADGKPFEPEEGGKVDEGAGAGTGYPGPEIGPGRDFDPEEGGPVDPAAGTESGYPGPEIGEGERLEE